MTLERVPGEHKQPPLILAFSGSYDYLRLERSISDFLQQIRRGSNHANGKTRIDIEYKVIEPPTIGRCPDCQKPGENVQKPPYFPDRHHFSHPPSGLGGPELPGQKKVWSTSFEGIELNLVNVFGAACPECDETLYSDSSANFIIEAHTMVLQAAGLSVVDRVIEAIPENPRPWYRW